MIKKLFSVFSILAPAIMCAQLNVTFRAQLTYPGQTCANICGYVDTTGREYALVGASKGMSIVDVTNPSAPVQVKQIPGPDNLWKEIKVRGKYAYVTSEGGMGLQIVNLSSLPDTTGLVYHYYTGDGPIAGSLNTIHSLHIDGNYVYLYGSNLFGGGAVACSLVDPWNPVYAGNYQNTSSPYVHDGYVRNDTLYAGHIYAGFFSVVDFTNKSAPVELASQYTPNHFTHNTWLSTNSKTLFTTDEVSNSFLTSYDISDLSNITELDKVQSNPGSLSIVHNVHIINVAGNDYAVTSWYRDGFTIVDAGRPQNLVQVGNYDTYPAGSGDGFDGDWGVYPFLPSGTIVVSNIDEGLFVFSPNYVRACYLEGNITDSVCGVQLNNVHISAVAAGITDSTDLAGDYKTGTPTPGTYNVTFTKSGYVTKTVTGVVLSPGVVNNLNVQMVPFSTVSINGTTQDLATSAALSGVQVAISDPSNQYSFVSDASGNFASCNVVSATDYDVVAGKWGYNTVCLSGQTLDGANNTPVYSLQKGYYDDFSLNFGWTTSGTATTGQWIRGIPVGTMNGAAQSNPGYDDSTDCGGMAYVTGNAGGTASNDDIDNGYTLLTSPVFDLTGYTVPYMDYTRWFYNGGGAGFPNDSLTISISNGISTVLIESVKSNTPGMSTWIHRSIKVSDYVTPTATMTVLVQAADNAPGHLVEAGFDKWLINEGPTTVAESGKDANMINAFPNPFTSEISLRYSLKSQPANGAKLVITDIAGRIVYEEKITSATGELQLQPSTGAGIYFAKIISGTEVTSAVKLVKTK